MLIEVEAHLLYETTETCDLLLQIEALNDADQRCLETEMLIDPETTTKLIEGEDGLGQRRWLVVQDRFDCRYRSKVDITRPEISIDDLASARVSEVPQNVVKYLMPSRYCHPEEFISFVPDNLAGLSGGALVQAMSDWIGTHITYDINASDPSTTASTSFERRRGVCRDYAHVLIAMLRAVAIPARFVSAYAPDVTPQDFHAVAEAYLGGAWHLIDPTGMAKASEIARIGVGRDAADVSFMTSYGWMELKKQTVTVKRLG